MSPCPVIYASWHGGLRYVLWGSWDLSNLCSELWCPAPVQTLVSGVFVYWTPCYVTPRMDVALSYQLRWEFGWGENLGLTLKCFRTDDPPYNTASSFDLPSSLSVKLLGIISLLLHSGDYLILLSLRPLLEERQWSTWLCQKAGKSGLGKPWLGLRTKNTIL